MNRKSIFIKLLWIGFLFTAFQPAALSKAEPIYFFQEHLPDAEAFIVREVEAQKSYMKDQVSEVYATWEDGQFSFKESISEHPIKVINQEYEGYSEKGIYFHPSEGVKKVIRFLNVPPGAKLFLRYGIADRGLSVKEPATVYFSIYVGKKKLARIQVGNEPGWQQRELKLGPLVYLKRSVAVTFEVACDNANQRHFAFMAEIHK